MSNPVLVLFSIIVALATSQGIVAVDYGVTNTASNTAGGARFDRDIGEPFALQTMNDATNFIWNTFQQTSPDEKKDTQRVDLFIDDNVRDDWVAYTMNDQIHYSARKIESDQGDVKNGFAGVVYHEMAHVWQWNGGGQTPGGLIEGIADFVRLKADYAPSHWVGPGQGERWDQGYDVTARFLDYCDGLRNGFVAELNKKMRDSYSADYFVDLLGKTVDQLWAEYKATYGTA